MYIYFKASQVKAGLALRVVVVYLHLLVLNGAATIRTAPIKLLVNAFPYRFAQSHNTPFFINGEKRKITERR
jgi:hypothetical protein